MAVFNITEVVSRTYQIEAETEEEAEDYWFRMNQEELDDALVSETGLDGFEVVEVK